MKHETLVQNKSYRAFLKEILVERIQNNPSYSLRGFASQLGISSSTLSAVLKGERNLSLQMASIIADKLNLTQKEAEIFSLKVQLESSKKIQHKEILIKKLNVLIPSDNTRDLSVDVFKMMSEWYHIAILVCLELKSQKKTTAKILGSLLHISTLEAQSALDRLCSLELAQINEDKTYSLSKEGHLNFKSEIPNLALRKFHQDMMQMSARALEVQSPQERYVGSETIAIHPAAMKDIEKAAYEFREKVKTIAQNSVPQSEVYHLGIQFFRLTNTKIQRSQS